MSKNERLTFRALAKVIIDPKLLELTTDVFTIFFNKK